jgi:hypothetical protein
MKFGSLNIETVKYGHESDGTQGREILRWRVPAVVVKYRPVLSPERAPHNDKKKKKGQRPENNFRGRERKILMRVLDGGLIP